MAKERQRRSISKGRLLLFTLVTPFLFLCLIEGGARVVEQIVGAKPGEARSPCAFQLVPLEVSMPAVPETDWQVIEVSVEWADNENQTVETTKPDDELRVVLLGGSALGGWGLPRGAQLAWIAERLLNEASPDRRVRVINLGKTGWASPQISWVFGRAARRLDPDLVVTVMGNNERTDITNALELGDGDPDKLFMSRWVSRTFALARLLEPQARVDLEMPSPPMPDLVDVEHEDRINEFVAARLKRTLKRIRKDGRAPLLVTSVAVNHRYHRREREWFFAGEEAVESEAYRTAHWAWYHSAPSRGLAAMTDRSRGRADEPAAPILLGMFQLRAGDEAAAVVSLAAGIQLLGEPSELDREGRLLLAWATAALEGTEAARQLVAPWLEELSSAGAAGRSPCEAPDLLWYAGDVEGAATRYEACVHERMYYRADGFINDALEEAADHAGADFYDLESDVRAASPDGVPGFETFFDYCHYTPRGNILAGHLLAGRIALELDLPGEIPAWQEGVAAYDRGFAGRLRDRPEIDRYTGVDFDVTLLTQQRRDLQNERRQGDVGSLIGRTFDGNANASAASESDLESVRLAFWSYLSALELDPGYEPAKLGIRRLAATGGGQLFLGTHVGDAEKIARIKEIGDAD